MTVKQPYEVHISWKDRVGSEGGGTVVTAGKGAKDQGVETFHQDLKDARKAIDKALDDAMGRFVNEESTKRAN